MLLICPVIRFLIVLTLLINCHAYLVQLTESLNHALGDFTLLFGWREGHLALKNTESWYVVGDDLTGALHVFKVTTSSSVCCCNRIRMVWHSDTGLSWLSWKLTVKRLLLLLIIQQQIYTACIPRHRGLAIILIFSICNEWLHRLYMNANFSHLLSYLHIYAQPLNVFTRLLSSFIRYALYNAAVLFV